MKLSPEAIEATRRRAQEPIRRQDAANDTPAEAPASRLAALQGVQEAEPASATDPDFKSAKRGSEGPSCGRFEFSFPLKTVTGLNAREHPFVRRDRQRKEKAATYRAMRKALGVASGQVAGILTLPVAVTLTRIETRTADSDGAVTALKAVRDAVAAFLGVDDGSDWVEWVYRQEKGKALGVKVQISPAGAATPRENLQGCSEGVP